MVENEAKKAGNVKIHYLFEICSTHTDYDNSSTNTQFIELPTYFPLSIAAFY